jgi:hypothetical protein
MFKLAPVKQKSPEPEPQVSPVTVLPSGASQSLLRASLVLTVASK